MPSNNRQSPGSGQKQLTGPRKNEVTPLMYSPGLGKRERDTQWREEDDLLAEDDPLASNPPRPSSSAIRLNNPVSSRRVARDISPETTRNMPVPNRRAGQVYPPLFGQIQAQGQGRPARSTTIQQAPPLLEKHGHRNVHWLLYVGVGMIAALALWVVGSSVLAWGTAKYNDVVYGYPRTYHMDAVVGHGGDSPQQPSHFVALNLRGQVIVMELMAGNPAKSINYTGPNLFESGGDLVPVTLEFRDVTGDGKPDMLIHIQDKVFVFVNDGTKFRPSTANDTIHL